MKTESSVLKELVNFSFLALKWNLSGFASLSKHRLFYGSLAQQQRRNS